MQQLQKSGTISQVCVVILAGPVTENTQGAAGATMSSDNSFTAQLLVQSPPACPLVPFWQPWGWDGVGGWGGVGRWGGVGGWGGVVAGVG